MAAGEVMAPPFPVLLDLRGRACVVIGGGMVAERRVASLLTAGAAVTVVSPRVTAALAADAAAGRLRHVARAFAPADLDGALLAFTATDDGRINAEVAREGRARGVWVNAADDPAHCDFLLPAVVRRGPLVVAVGTGGRSPALARAVREELEAWLTDDHATLATLAGDVRAELHGQGLRATAEAWRAALGAEVRALIAAGRPEDARARMRGRLLEAAAPATASALPVDPTGPAAA
jgi:siroheme synthase-like protein